MRPIRDDERRVNRRGAVLVLLALAAFLVCGAGLVSLAGLESPAGSNESTAIPGAFSRARRLLDEGKIAEAKEIFTDELKRDGKNIEAIRGLALCARDEGDDETALQYFQKLTALAPKDRAGWRQLALAASRLGRDMEALAAAQAALSLAPDGDRAMTDLMTRLLSSKNSLANGILEDPLSGIGPTGRVRNGTTTDPLSRIPRPKVPEPSQNLPKPGRGE
jgi:tetratricopeptide (TPR) repeat protein